MNPEAPSQSNCRVQHFDGGCVSLVMRNPIPSSLQSLCALGCSLVLVAACGPTPSLQIHPPESPDSGTPPPVRAQATVEQGVLRGQDLGASIAFLGVPYAAPPVGALRWQAPAAAGPWSGVRDATSFASACIHLNTENVVQGGSEDCLYLNVWTPSVAPAKALPVLVWIHGGFYLNGAGSLPGYNGRYLSEHGPAVVVTLNYRLGALGFINHPALDAESATGTSGNYGIMDQIAALGWVQRNIGKLGGDPKQVMIFGASAGGGSTCLLYTSPLAQGLFSSAIAESTSCNAVVSSVGGEKTFNTLATNLGCSPGASFLSCLRSKDAQAVMTAYPTSYTNLTSHRWSVWVDGHVVPDLPMNVIAQGKQNKVPFIIGTTSNEYSTLMSHYLTTPPANELDYETAARSMVGVAAGNAALPHYLASDYPSYAEALISMASDRFMVCPTRTVARAIAKSGAPVRRYLFDHTYESGNSAALGAGHYMDVPFQFHNLAIEGFVASPAEGALSDTMVGYWTRMAAQGDPNGAGAPVWPAYDAAADLTLVLDDIVHATPAGVRTAPCDFWDAFLGL